ncbi:MAG TPA: helix-hairpin-helix domain-containing protein [Clostridia bacterium]|nr:helix-hairpin-helix domain-containing protein [Clostridia bacterium]
MIYITRTQKSLLVAAVLVLVIISGTIYLRQEKATEISLGEAVELKEAAVPSPAEVEAHKEPEEISVYICGNVKKPGVIKVPEGTRLDEAVRMAGGTCENADLNAVNLAYRLVDEDMIYIPKIGEEPKSTDKAIPGVSTVKSINIKEPGKVNINTAGANELETLDGVGPATARSIIEYREESGPFESIEDIKQVKGIGDGKFNSIKDDITVE